jgi:hypothetical protein
MTNNQLPMTNGIAPRRALEIGHWKLVIAVPALYSALGTMYYHMP